MKADSEIINRDHPFNLQKAVETLERSYIIHIIQKNDGDKVKASEMLGIRIQMLEQKI